MDPPRNDHCGFDDKLFVTVPPEYLRCGICCLVLRNPVQILQCGHKYCAVCFQRIKGHAERNNRNLLCPIDREIIDITRVCEDLGLRRAIGSLPVQCSRAERGCLWTGELSDIDRHQEKCSFGLQPQTSVENTEVLALVKGLSERVEVCENSLIEKEKEVLHLKYSLNEMKVQHDNEINRMSKEITEIKTLHDDDVNRLNAEVRVLTEKNEDIEKNVLSNVDKLLGVEARHEDMTKEMNVLKKKMDEMQTKISEVESRTFKSDDIPGIKYSENKSREPQGAEGGAVGGSEGESERKGRLGKSSELSRGKDVLMKVHKGSKPESTVISGDNTIQFEGYGYPTVSLANGVVTKGQKVWYEVQVVERSLYYLRVGWAREGFVSSEESYKVVGDCQFGYSIIVTNKIEYCCHNNSFKPWGGEFNGVGQNVFGVAIDMVSGRILFSGNGRWTKPFGIAFDDIETNHRFFPAISFAWGKVQVNMGERDFMFGPPDNSYKSVVDIL